VPPLVQSLTPVPEPAPVLEGNRTQPSAAIYGRAIIAD
jgi:hypothetical protein